jgi:hypothetical protein
LEIPEIHIQPINWENLKGLLECHDSLVTGHPGHSKTYNLLS